MSDLKRGRKDIRDSMQGENPVRSRSVDQHRAWDRVLARMHHPEQPVPDSLTGDSGKQPLQGQDEGGPTIGKKPQDNLGYIYSENDKQYVRVPGWIQGATHEGSHPIAGDIIASSENYEIYKHHTEKMHGKLAIEIDKEDREYSSFEKGRSTFLYFSGKGSEQEGVRRENTILMIA
jgi:hypothetical protein